MLLKKFNISIVLNYAILAYIFILPLSRAGINIIGAIVIVLWIIEGNFKEKFSKINKTYIMIFILSIFMLISYLWTKNYNYANFYTFKYLHYFLLSFVVFTSLKKEFVNKAITSFISGIFLSELVSYSIFLRIYHKSGIFPSDPAPFMNHIEYSFYLVIAAVILIDRFFSFKKWNKEKIFSIIFFITISFNLFIINGRTGQFTYIVVLFLIFLVYFKLNWKTLVLSIVFGISGSIFLYKVSPNFHNKVNRTINVFDKKINYCSSEGKRVAMTEIGSRIFLNNLIIGVGIGDPIDTFHEYVKNKYHYGKCSLKYNHLHNQYIQEAAQLGIIGLLLLVTIFYFTFKESKDKRFAFLIIVAILLSFNGDVLLSRQFSIALITFLIAISLKKENNENKYNNNSIK